MNTYTIPLITPEKPMEIKKDTKVFDKIIGQSACCKQLAVYVASHSIETPFPTMLFTGSQGLGKTYMAQKVAEALGRKMVEINCGVIESTKDFIDIFKEKVIGTEPKTLFLDESQELSRDVSETLKTLLAPNDQLRNTIEYKGLGLEYDFRNINTIFATTDSYRMQKELVNRCKKIYFHLYNNEDLMKILDFYLPNTILTCDHIDLAYACRGRARDTFLLSQDIKRYCGIKDTSTFTESLWEEFKETFSIHSHGLKSEEVELLNIISKCQPCSIHNLAVRMGVKEKNIELELEVRAKELGLIDNTARGRVLTNDGKEYLAGRLKMT